MAQRQLFDRYKYQLNKQTTLQVMITAGKRSSNIMSIIGKRMKKIQLSDFKYNCENSIQIRITTIN